jgi:hypothetical protein
MEGLWEKLRAARTNFETKRQNIQANGTPLRSYARIARESVESSYGEMVSSVNQVERNIDQFSEKIEQFRQNHAEFVSYCQIHPTTAIFGSAGAVAIPSYFGKPRSPLISSRSCSLWHEGHDYRSPWCCFLINSLHWRPPLLPAQA